MKFLVKNAHQHIGETGRPFEVRKEEQEEDGNGRRGAYKQSAIVKHLTRN